MYKRILNRQKESYVDVLANKLHLQIGKKT